VGSISDDPYSAARCVPDRPVPSIACRLGVNAPVCAPLKTKEKAHADNWSFRPAARLRTFPDTCDYSRITGYQETILKLALMGFSPRGTA
jgi:hypothetical protein